MRREPQGKKVGEAVAGQGRAGVRPAPRRGREGASPTLSSENVLAAGTFSARSTPDVAGASFSHAAPAANAQHQQIQGRAGWQHGTCQARCGQVHAISPASSTAFWCTVLFFSNVHASISENKDAISASGALNRPRLSSGGTTASTASSFSVGSMRRYTSVVRISA